MSFIIAMWVIFYVPLLFSVIFFLGYISCVIRLDGVMGNDSPFKRRVKRIRFGDGALLRCIINDKEIDSAPLARRALALLNLFKISLVPPLLILALLVYDNSLVVSS